MDDDKFDVWYWAFVDHFWYVVALLIVAAVAGWWLGHQLCPVCREIIEDTAKMRLEGKLP